MTLLGTIRNWFGSAKAPPARMVGTRTPRIQGRYDNSLWTDENARNWWQADYLSAKSANNFQVRRQLRLRSRYELSNNPYLFGVCNSNADDLVNTGPTLQCLRGSTAENRQVESAWNEWADEVHLTEKLRTLKLARTVDGEGFLILKTVEDMECPVSLYPVDVEADQVTTPAPKNLQELWVDGLILHKVTGRPIAYDVLRTHPGDYFYPNLNPLEFDRIKARFVIHWFPKFRPGQVRGVPIFTPALDLFTELRSYRKAVLNKAQVAANLTAVLESEGPADPDGGLTPTPFDTIPIDRGVLTTLPGGAKIHQYDPGEPGTTYEMFQEHCLGEACRPLNYPLSLALGTSQKFNFSSAKLDHINYRNSLNVEREDCDRVVLERLFRAWLDEAIMIPGLLPGGINGPADVPHEWHWPGYEPLDPVTDAQADHDRLSNGTLTWQQFWASRGYDWRAVMAQQEEEREEIEQLGLVFGEPLKKTEKVDETDPEGTQAAARHRIEAYDPDQPRDDEGQWAPSAGEKEMDRRHDAEEKALDEAHDVEEKAMDQRHDREDAAADRVADREDAKTDRQRAREDRATEKARDDEDDARRDRHKRELDELDRRHEAEKAPEHRRTQETAAHEARQARETKAVEIRRAKEDEATESRRGGEDKAREGSRQREADTRSDRQGREKDELYERHGRENGSLTDRHDAERQELERREAEGATRPFGIEGYDPDQPRDEQGRFGTGGKKQHGAAAFQRRQLARAHKALARVGNASWEGLKKMGAAAGHVEHLAKEWSAEKLEAGLARLPPRPRAVARGALRVAALGTKAAFATHIAGQKMAEAVALEKGLSPEQARALRGTLATLDVALSKPVTLGGELVGGRAGGVAMSLVPVASAGYLAYSTARDPRATLRAARKGAHAAARRLHLMAADDAATPDAVRDLADRYATREGAALDRYTALVAAALDATKSLSLAIRVADAAEKDEAEKTEGAHV